MNFSVLMSIYYKETTNNLVECLESLVNQTLLPNEIVIVKDGPLTSRLDDILERYSKAYPNLFKLIQLESNVGLGTALSIGVEKCSYEIIARMDTDDICALNRFEVQIEEFKKHPNLALIGSNIIEFDKDCNDIISKRIVPTTHEEIIEYAKKRNPFNHMTVMYKKSVILSIGNYQPPNGFEDYYLWARLLVSNYKTKNLSQPLVYARTGINMFERRGGYSYLKKVVTAKKLFYKIGLYSFTDFLISCLLHTIVSIFPNKLRKYIYLKFLRKED